MRHLKPEVIKVYFTESQIKNRDIHPFWFLGDCTFGDGLALIGSYN